jgi:hypothetical protein
MTEEERAQMAALRKDVDALLREQEDQERESIRSLLKGGDYWGPYRDHEHARDVWEEGARNPMRHTMIMIDHLIGRIEELEGRLEKLLVSLAEPQLHPPQVTATDLLEEIRQRRSP